MRHDYTVVYQTIEDGWIMATVPELPGAVTQGATLEEARANINADFHGAKSPHTRYRKTLLFPMFS